MMKAFWKKISHRIFKSSEQPLFLKGDKTLTENAIVSIRNGEKNPLRCKFGIESVISGHFVLETEEASIHVGDRTFIGGGQFVSAKKITIGSDVLISWGCTFIDTNAHPLNWEDRQNDVAQWKKGIEDNKLGTYKNWAKVISKEIKINDKCWIGFNCIILKGVEIGEGAIIGAGSVVTENVPPFTVYAGNPAKLVKQLKEDV